MLCAEYKIQSHTYKKDTKLEMKDYEQEESHKQRENRRSRRLQARE